MDERNDTRHETLMEVADEPLSSVDALVARCHRALTAHLWATCCWPEERHQWKIGDFNYLVLSVAPDADACLYVQFWSEPAQPVLSEVGSGEWCPGSLRYIGPDQRKAIAARGFTIGGDAKNFRKELVIDSVAAAEAAALEALQVLWSEFGYRGQWPLELERHSGERADLDAVYRSLTPEDFAKVAAAAGFSVTATEMDDAPVLALKQGRRVSLAFLDGRVPGQNLYSLVTLQGELALRAPVTDAAIAHANTTMRFVTVVRPDAEAILVRMSLALDGGVTTDWMTAMLRHWIGSWRECERQFRRIVRRRRAPRRRTHRPSSNRVN